jgi:hypothetical protein
MKPSIPFDPHAARLRRLARKIYVLDAMVLIAATAAGFLVDRLIWFDVARGAWLDLRGWKGNAPKDFQLIIAVGIVLSMPLAASWTVASLALQLRRPRYRLRRLLCRTGMAACCAAVPAFAVGAGMVICTMRANLLTRTSRSIVAFGMPVLAGSNVIAVWTVLMIIGGHRAASDWHDRLGRLIGLYWVMAILAVGWMLNFLGV